MSDVAVGIQSVEMQEYLMSGTTARTGASAVAHRSMTEAIDQLQQHLRGAMRLHRFMVMNWLMMNGVKIPIELLDDRTHPEVGAQMPDTKVIP